MSVCQFFGSAVVVRAIGLGTSVGLGLSLGCSTTPQPRPRPTHATDAQLGKEVGPPASLARPAWPPGTFLVVNGEPVDRSIWDARWALRWNAKRRGRAHGTGRMHHAMTNTTRGLVDDILVRQAVERRGIVVTEEDLEVLRVAYFSNFRRIKRKFNPATSVWPSFEASVILPAKLEQQMGVWRVAVPYTLYRGLENPRPREFLERKLRETAEVLVVGPPASLARVGEHHISRRACSRQLGRLTRPRQAQMAMSRCVTRQVVELVVAAHTGSTPERGARARLNRLLGSPPSDGEILELYRERPDLFADGEEHEMWEVLFPAAPRWWPAEIRRASSPVIASRFAKDVRAGEPFLPLARSYVRSGEAVLTHKIAPVPPATQTSWFATLDKGDVFGPAYDRDGGKVFWIVDRRPGPLLPLDHPKVRGLAQEHRRQTLLPRLFADADVEIFEPGLELSETVLRALP